MFSYFQGPTQGGGFSNFSFFLVFPPLGGFCALYEADGIASLDRFSQATLAFGVLPLLLPLATGFLEVAKAILALRS